MKKKELIKIILIVVSFIIINIILYLISPVYTINSKINALKKDYSEKEFLELENIISDLYVNSFIRKENLIENVRNFHSDIPQYNSQYLFDFVELPIRSIDTEEIPTDYAKQNSSEPLLVEGFQYISQNGQNGEITFYEVTFENDEVLNLNSIVSKEPLIEITSVGNLNSKDFESQVKDLWLQLIDVAKVSNPDKYSKLTYNPPEYSKTITVKDKFEKLSDSTFSYSENKEMLNDEALSIGSLKLIHTDCKTAFLNIDVVFYIKAKIYKFINLDNIIDFTCPPISSGGGGVYIPPANIITLNCTDCTYAPVSKKYSLKSTYAPAVVPTGLSGGGYVTQQTKNALTNLFNDAANNGISITIASSYRSYATQQTTFEYWVQKEIAKGYSRAQAEANANTYSARPGLSEHQLGTTADLRCTSCAAFDNSAGNVAMYNFLKQNAHKYGFIISYPQGKDSITGYVYEPWHVRYIGVDLATELFNRNYLGANGEYLAKFLEEKNLY